MSPRAANPQEEKKPSGEMKAMQILQTIMLTFLVGGLGWMLTTTIQNGHSLARIEESYRNQDAQIARVLVRLERLDNEIDKLHESDNLIEHRVTVLETRKP